MRNDYQQLKIGKAETCRSGNDVALLAVGAMVPVAQEAAVILSSEGIEAEVVNMRFIKPVDEALLQQLAVRIKTFVTVEDNVVDGGFGSAVLESLAHLGILDVSVKIHGLPDEFIQHGSPAELYRLTRLDPKGIASVTQEFLQSIQQRNREKISHQ